MTNPTEIWQVEAGGAIYEARFEELGEWIAEGSLLPQDKVRRGNLRWLEAGKIPLLFGFFNAKELGLPMPVLQANDEPSQPETNIQIVSENIISPLPEFVPSENEAEFVEQSQDNFPVREEIKTESRTKAQTPQNFQIGNNFCNIHQELAAEYVCEVCAKGFCKACPKSFGGTVKICPLCGALCKPVKEILTKQKTEYKRQAVAGEDFGFADIGRAFAFPFRYKASFIFGAVMFMFFTLGESASAFGGIYMIWAAIVCGMLANTLSFGILANTVENFSKGETERNFMPDFEDFNLWDDVIHPFFLSIGVYISSFGLLILLCVGALWFTWQTASSQTSSQLQAISLTKETVNSAPKPPRIENGQIIMTDNELTPEARAALQDGNAKKMQELMQENQKAQVESMVGKTPEQQQQEYFQAFQRLGALIIPFLLLAFIAFLWGLFYFPAACAVAGYTRSISETLNPLVGLDTIKRLGFDYAKILGVCLTLGIVYLIVSTVLHLILSPFNLPKMGNLPAAALVSIPTFYFTIVFSVTLGFALFKNGEKLNLYRA
ncbi:MAG: plasminogen receptor (KT) [Acidobacteriota bacterium]|nr:plasminogen receptor (KT) [Acidobacteriota bacterium]